MNRRTAAPAALILSASLALAGCSSGTSDDSSSGHHGEATAQSTAANDADVMFATMMIPHHEQAIEMSDVLLAKEGVEPRVTALARRIKAAQGPEIEQLRTWLERWGADPADGAGHGSMDGMMSHEDMAALESARGEQAGRLFLEQMIEHHEGAIEMARTEAADGRDEDARELARSIVATQDAEIAQMRALLGDA